MRPQVAREKSAKEIGEILSEQLDLLTAASADDFVLKKADTIANVAGKMMKQASLELAYAEASKRPIPVLPSLTR